MTPDRSLAASVLALGFASSFTTPLPAAAAAPCERAGNYAAQSGAEIFRVGRLAVPTNAAPERPNTKAARPSKPAQRPDEEGAKVTDSAGQLLGPDAGLTDGNLGDSGQGVTGFLSGSSDLLKSITNGGVTTPGAPQSATDNDSGGQGGGGPVSEHSPIREIHPGEAGPGRLGRHETGRGNVSRAEARQSATGHGNARLGRVGRGDVAQGDVALGDVGLGEVRTGMLAAGRTNSAAVAQMLDGKANGPNSLTKPLAQQAPPTPDRSAARSTPAATAGPLTLGRGDLGARARWDAATTCGTSAGEAARSDASLDHFDLLKGDNGSLVRVPEEMSGRSTTAMERHGTEPRATASATVAAGRLTLADGKIKLRLLRPPLLTASMATGSGGDVRYQPAVLEVTAPGIGTRRLATAGDSIDISLDASTHSQVRAGRATQGQSEHGYGTRSPESASLPG